MVLECSSAIIDPSLVQMKLFEEARRQLVGAISEDAAAVPRVVQLGECCLPAVRLLLRSVYCPPPCKQQAWKRCYGRSTVSPAA